MNEDKAGKKTNYRDEMLTGKLHQHRQKGGDEQIC